MKNEPANILTGGALHSDLRELIASARQTVARGVNAALVTLYWKVGDRLRRDVLGKQRAEYGKEILSTLSKELTSELRPGFSALNLSRMMAMAEGFPDQTIVSGLVTHLGWSQFVEILPLKQPLQRDFYAEMCRIGRWSVLLLREKTNGMLYRRTALSKKPEELINQELRDLREQDLFMPDLVFRYPYLLDFLGLKDSYSEKDLETAILRNFGIFDRTQKK
ncbi:MAG: DUF1016 family protein [Verrucomicrobiaceae bacterium]|nr:MAG: DUF1016 family protein [Verrucomicrobiaceae bacterium]